MDNTIKWWAYLHVEGNIQLKRYFGPEDLSEAWASPMVLDVAGPWEVKSREEALVLATKELKK